LLSTRRRRGIVWIVCALLAGAALVPVFSTGRAPEAPPHAEVVVGDVVQLVQAAGVVVPREQLDVGAQVNGQIRAVHVELGQNVKAGQLLVSIDPDTARSEVRVAEASLVEQKAQINVKRTLLQFAKSEVERQRRLLPFGGTTRSAAERAESDAASLEAEVFGLTASLDRYSAEVTKSTLALSRTDIKAPIDGVVVDIVVAQGQTVNASQVTPVLMTLARLDEMTVRTRVAEADIGKVKVGQHASFVTLAGEAQTFEGTVRVIQPVPERSGSASFYNVLFEVPNKARVLLPQMTVLVHIDTGSAARVPTIPVVALAERQPGGRYQVYVLDAANQPRRRLVKIGLFDDSKAQVVEGLRVGERVLLAAPDGEAPGERRADGNKA
jgi:macrolide-specific efflux system membrane fusion protein